MTPTFVAFSLTKNMKRVVGINTLFLTLIVPIALVNINNKIFTIAVVALGVGLGLWNYFFVNRYYFNKAESVFMKSCEKLQQSVSFDELTGVYNRRTGMMRLHEEFARSRRTGENLTLAMLDIDHFKDINDTYGHQAGDYVLKNITKTIKQELRENDLVFRYGGEEFLIILPDIDKKQAIFPLDRLRKRLSKKVVSYNGFRIKTSVSIGVASVLPVEEDEKDAISRADAALYTAKRSGRNKVSYYGSAPGLKAV